MNGLRRFLTGVLCNPYLVAGALIALAAATPWLSEAARQMASFTLVNILLAASIYVLTGMAGQISLGQAGFMGIGAYCSVLLVKNAGCPFWLSLPAGVALSALVGYLLSFPAGRVREFYLAMMTVAFGMIFVEIAREWDSLTGGVMGVVGVPSPQLRNLEVFGIPVTTGGYLQFLVVVTAATLYALDGLLKSRVGRAFFAIHESELAAQSIGINSGRTKQLAYVVSAGLAGLGGTLYGHLVSYIGPESFELHRSIEILVMSVIGGVGSLAGQLIGGVTLTLLPHQLEAFEDYKFIAYGVVLVSIFYFAPRGLAGMLLQPPRVVRRRFAERTAASPLADIVPTREHGKTVLEWTGLRRDFAGLTAFTDFSAELKSGEVLGLVGPNGSGKSTTVNVLTGLYAPTAGKVMLKGADVSGLASDLIAKRGMVRTFQDPRLIGNFTTLENIVLGSHLRTRYSIAEALTGLGRFSSAERKAIARAQAIIEWMELGEVRDLPLDSLPYGYRRLIEIARALIVEPDVILLDEPAAGLSEGEIERLGRVVRMLRERGVAVLIIDHHMDFLHGLVDKVIVLDGGVEIYRGDMDGMRADARVAECYLGKAEFEDA